MRPIIIFADEKITKDTLIKAVGDAYEQGYKDGRASVYSITCTSTAGGTGAYKPQIYYTTTSTASTSAGRDDK